MITKFASLRFSSLLIFNRSTLYFGERPPQYYYLYNPSHILRRTPAAKKKMPVVAEYAKSNRSSCKSCSEKIAVKSLRLGLISKGPGGVDMTRWHHFDCFPSDSEPIASADDIQGLSALEKDDQDALMKMVEQCGEESAKNQDEKKVTVKVGPKRFKENNAKVIADYAKSSRSSCKRCSQTIDSKDLRLGLVTKDSSRGFDVTSWHHFGCFPREWNPIHSVEDIGGYSSLEHDDQKALKEWAEHCRKGISKDELPKLDEENAESVADNELMEETNKGKHSPVAKLVEQCGEPAKELDEDEEIKKPASDVKISGEKIKETKETPDSSKVNAEYAKSSRSTCKQCSQTIAAKELRLGLVTRNFRGFDMTQWHHLGCFPVDSDPIGSVEEIGGFSELQSGDQDALKELFKQCGKKTLVDKMDEDNDESDNTRLTEETNKRKHSEVVKMADEDDSQTKANQHTSRKHKVNNNESTSQVEVEAEISLSASDVKDKYRDANLLPKWKAFETVIFLERDDGLKDSEKIAAFDFDGCLAKTSVKITGAHAWSLMYPSIPEKLQSLYNQGYKLVIFTNESNIDRWKNKRQAAVDSKIGRLNSFIKRVEVPIQVFIACGFSSSAGKDDRYRKPKAGMWQLMKKHFNSGIAIDMDKSFYVGDAAGRKMDHSDADIKFAQANGLKFYTPEEYFISSST
ncbi:PREDICTED: polynucleotide 3'-phosphatase ZDP isoform X2 [Camelina sativa]|uniref:Polynucleotide 3'-phosphatase ZDP isoform X2 n=1 Tax=Camelina sativa TaxID=90675 RepID=A0ABM0YK98_CAMSA|nr:PREDICTED: polynucleotide 3'-phosphatase ZDP isoform X2 [Camelina sativa]